MKVNDKSIIPGWLRPKQAAEYCGVSERTLREWLKGGLRCVRKGNIVLIKVEWFDSFLEGFETDDQGFEIDRLVDDMVEGVTHE